MANVYLYIDATELTGLLEKMKGRVSPVNFDKLMRRTLNEVGKRSKKPVSDAVRQEYEGKVSWIKAGIKSAQTHIEGSGFSLSGVIPLQGSRGINKVIFPAGGQQTKGKIPKGKRSYVWISTVKGAMSRLPYQMKGYGGQPPFINGGPRIVTRAGKSRYPLYTVAGLALPQMPLNKGKDETRERILKLCEERVVHNFEYMFGGL